MINEYGPIRKPTDYYFTFPDRPYICCYSAGALENEMNGLVRNRQLCNIYTDAEDYASAYHAELNFLNLAGERVLLEFDNCFIDFCIQSYSIIQYRFYTKDEVIIHHQLLSSNSTAMCNISHLFSPAYTGEFVEMVRIRRTGFYGYWHNGFDKEKLISVSKLKDLPKDVVILLSNSTSISIGGWDSDLYIILGSGKGLSVRTMAAGEEKTNC